MIDLTVQEVMALRRILGFAWARENAKRMEAMAGTKTEMDALAELQLIESIQLKLVRP